jgi:hypothetical protein
VTLPKRSPTHPADLAGVPNGNLPPELLTSIGTGGQVHALTARTWRALVAAAGQVGLPMTYTYGGTYRSYKAQEALFKSRYAPGGTYGDCKRWNGALWCKTGNYATAAVPGTSNHGLGLAIDCAFDKDPLDGLGPEDAAAINGHPQWPWLVANAHRFGFWWSLDSEPWHIQYVTAEAIPAAVLEFEGQQTLPIPPPPPEDDDMAFPAPYLWQHAAYAVIWYVCGADTRRATPAEYEALKATLIVEAGPAADITLDSICHRNGLDPASLPKV